MDLNAWTQEATTSGWGQALPAYEEEGERLVNQTKKTKKQKKGGRSQPSPQQESQSQPYDQETQPQATPGVTNDWVGGGGVSNNWDAIGDSSGGGGGWHMEGGNRGDSGSRWDVALRGDGNNGSGGDAGGGGDSNQWLQAANQATNHSHQQLPENLGRALTLADLVKQIVTGNPSRTLWYAATDLSRNLLGEDALAVDGLQYLGSGGAALEEADTALYSSLRPASQRIHWTFSPMKDDRVAQLLDWIQVMSYALGTLGLQNFLTAQQRGALISNVGFRNPNHPNYPAFDWLTFDDVVETRDKTLQESIARYDPESHVLVLPVPNAVLKQNYAEVTKVKDLLAKHKYAIKEDAPPAKQKKWYHVRW